MPSKNINKIALFVPNLQGGGAERVMVILANEFATRGLKVDLVLAKATGPYLSDLSENVRLVDLGSKRVLTSLASLVLYIRKAQPDAILSTLTHANIIVLWAKFLARSNARVILREADTLTPSLQYAPRILGRVMPRLIRWFYPMADGIIAGSKGVSDDLIKNGIVLPDKINVIHNPAVTPDIIKKSSVTFNHPWFVNGAPPVILGVGRLTEQKDFQTLIRAFALICENTSAHLVILGEGEDREKLQALIKQLDLDDKIELPGFVDNPFVYMAKSSVFVLSSKWEGLPNVLLHAMALGASVVATDCPSGPSEILDNGRYGALVSIGDVNSMAKAIQSYIQKPLLKHDHSEALAPFELENITDQYLSMLQG